jgi:trans-2,3-dihydro-3-hydroxyanthranilate isomerase
VTLAPAAPGLARAMLPRMRSLRYVVCDVFTERALAGNALAVFTDATGLDGDTMQAIARELNLSETVFVLRPQRGGHARMRIFTPRRELEFAGHPVLGTAFVLGAAIFREEIDLETARGPVPVRLLREGDRLSFGWMLQPEPTLEPFPEPDAVLAGLGIERTALPIVRSDNGVQHALVALPSADGVAAIEPNLERLARLPAVGFYVFAGSGTEYVARLFAPAAGIPEDPATGSAAGPLAAYLVRTKKLAFGATLRISQGAQTGRPSTLHARVLGNGDQIEAIEVGGSAVTVARGEFRIP